MAVLENSIQIPAPKDKVWNAIADLDVYGQWMTLHVDFPDGTPDEMKQGESFKEKVKIMGMPGDVTWTVAEFKEGELIELSGQGPMGTTLSASFKVGRLGRGDERLLCERVRRRGAGAAGGDAREGGRQGRAGVAREAARAGHRGAGAGQLAARSGAGALARLAPQH